jgi:hypothetical protein
MTTSPTTPEIQIWHIDRFVFYARSPRKKDAAVDRICESIREFGFKIRDNWLGLLPYKRNLKETYAN